MAEENKNPYDLVDQNNTTEKKDNPQKGSGIFVKKLIKGIAKIAWLPDPETWAPAKAAEKTAENATPYTSKAVNETNTTLEQDVAKQEELKKQEDEKKKFNFENVMSWVTWVLDKIEKKVEEKTGLDLDAPLKKREEKLQKEAEATKTEAAPSTTETTTNEPAPENEVEKNNEEYLSENH